MSTLQRVVSFLAVCVAGGCGGLIGWAVTDLQCDGACTVPIGLGGLVGAVVAAAGVGLIVVLAVQALAEWDDQEGQRRSA